MAGKSSFGVESVKKRYCGAPTGLCTLCGKVIRLDMFRHVANYNLELWRCPVSWCTQWKGTPHDCIDHIRLVHSVPATVKAWNLGRWLPPWTLDSHPGHAACNSQGHCFRGVDGCALIQPEWHAPGT